MSTRRFTFSDLQDLDCNEVASRAWRHGRHVTYVFATDGAHWRFEIPVHAEEGWVGEADDNIDATEVRLVDKTVKVWEAVP